MHDCSGMYQPYQDLFIECIPFSLSLPLSHTYLLCSASIEMTLGISEVTILTLGVRSQESTFSHDLPAITHTALCHLLAQHSHANVSSLVPSKCVNRETINKITVGSIHNMLGIITAASSQQQYSTFKSCRRTQSDNVTSILLKN